MKKVTLLSVSVFSLIGLLVSCVDDSPEPNSARPVKELYYNFETGQKVGEKTLTYDLQGRLTREYFTDLDNALGNKEVRYEYDADGNLLKKKQREPNVSDVYFINVYTYENGRKKSEAMQFDENLTGYKTEYFYSGAKLDSSRDYVYLQGAYKYQSTGLYEYDIFNRVVRAYSKRGSGNTIYRYSGDKLKETCNLVAGVFGDLEDCIENTYDSRGNLVRIRSKSDWDNHVQEEFFYSLNVLREKKVYFYPIYEPGNTVDVTLIKYQY